MQDRRPREEREDSSEFTDSLKKGLLVGAVLLVLIVPPLRMHRAAKAPQAPVAMAPATPAPAPSAPALAPQQRDPQVAPPQADALPPAQAGTRLADFRGELPSRDARQVADWVVFTRDNGRHAFVLVDKKDARVYVFGPDGTLKDSAPALLGAAIGDDSFPGIGDKPLDQVRPEEKTTPAGRYVAEPGRNANNEDVVWVDYDAAVSMHRIRPLVARERRLERLATLTVDDNRISFGCINLPVSFYEDALSPMVQQHGAVVYVLPDVKTPQQVFGSFDVRDPARVAAWKQAVARQAAAKNVAAPGISKVALQPQR